MVLRTPSFTAAIFATLLTVCFYSAGCVALAAATQFRRASVVTGANGYVGREIVHALLNKSPPHADDVVLCLVRPARIEQEKEYWKATSSGGCVKVMPYDMLDGRRTLSDALDLAYGGGGRDGDATECCVYHVASVFGPTDDHAQTALENVRGAEDVVRTISKFEKCKLVLTSSMAAVRGSGQAPGNGVCYTHDDWNTLSKRGDNWGSSYQWSKAESERRARDLCNELDVPMVSLCPSFVFGPPSDGIMSGSYSIALVGQWVQGKSPVQSRLCVDVRDVAKAHVAAGTLPHAVGNRYIISMEARIPSQDMAETLKAVAAEGGIGSPDDITCDTKFSGGAIKIGEREVMASDRMKQDLDGLVCRPVEETMADMGRALLEMLHT